MNKLEKLYDFQKYEQNKHLQSIIEDSMSRYSMELTDDMLADVSAAGIGNKIDVKKERENRK